MRYDINSLARKIIVHILLPKGKCCKKLLLNKVESVFEIEHIGDSIYVNVECAVRGKVIFEVIFS